MIKKMEHTAIIVKDMEESLNYYKEMFGFKLRLRGNNGIREMAFIHHEEFPQFEIELIKDLDGDTEYSKVSVVNHLAFTVDDIQGAMKFYKEKGIQFNSDKENTAIDGAKIIFFNGPNGELLQLVQPTRTY